MKAKLCLKFEVWPPIEISTHYVKLVYIKEMWESTKTHPTSSSVNWKIKAQLCFWLEVSPPIAAITCNLSITSNCNYGKGLSWIWGARWTDTHIQTHLKLTEVKDMIKDGWDIHMEPYRGTHCAWQCKGAAADAGSQVHMHTCTVCIYTFLPRCETR